MNKSTPISQLSGGNTTANIFMTNQQAAVMPQNTQNNTQINTQNNMQNNDMLAEDESTIQEVLNSINASQNMQTQQQQAPLQQQQTMQQQAAALLAAQSQFQQHVVPPVQTMMDPIDALMMQNIANSNIANNSFGMPHSSSSVEMFVQLFADDIKFAFVVGVVFIAVNFVPITSFLGNYVNIEKIPYHDVILKAVLAAVVVIAIKKFLQNNK
jgi:hypothetical protein